MRVFQLLQTEVPELLPDRCKIHLAGHNGIEDPLDVYLEGRFDEWQQTQNSKNFERDHVLSLIALPEKDAWLFAGAFSARGFAAISGSNQLMYELVRFEQVASLEGRLVVQFHRPGRQSYLLGEKWADGLLVSEIRSQRMRIAEFSGFKQTMLSKRELDQIVEQQVQSWKAALSSVSGVYVIADRNSGKLYIGSATGAGGIWSRWCSYSATGHGQNRELMGLLREQGPEYAENFQFGVLEISDTHASANDTIARETHWKRLLLSRPHGYNAN